MTPEQLFTYDDVWIVPQRGRYTALEVVEEWTEAIPDFLRRWDEFKGTDMADRIDGCARHAYAQSELDLKVVLPYLDGGDVAAKVQAFQEQRDRVREYIK